MAPDTRHEGCHRALDWGPAATPPKSWVSFLASLGPSPLVHKLGIVSSSGDGTKRN